MAFETMAEVRAVASVEAYAAQFLERARDVCGKPSFVCPECGNGSGSDGDGILYDEAHDRYHCFKCGRSLDIFDLAAAVNGWDGETRHGRGMAFRHVAEWAGCSNRGGAAPQGTPSKGAGQRVASEGVAARPVGRNATESAARRDVEPREIPEEAAKKAAEIKKNQQRQANYIAECQGAMTDDCPGMAYMNSRGFSADVVRFYGLGWDGWTRRVVIPWEAEGGYYHIDRAIDDPPSDGKGKYDKPAARYVGKQPIHNASAFDAGNKVEAVFIVEGMVDAYAIMASGYQASGLGGIGFESTIKEAARRRYPGTLVILTDFDDTGRATAEKALNMAHEMGVTAMLAPGLPEGAKDCGELYEKDPQALCGYLDEQYRAAQAEHEAEYAEALRSMRVTDTADTLTDIYTMRDAVAPVSTGFKSLDAAIGGGLFPGLVVLGAISSLGKTTLTVQVADHIAAAGRHVLFVTIEQSARELVAKSLSRTMRAMGNPAHDLATAQEMYDLTRRSTWQESKQGAFDAACSEYMASVAPCMHFIEGNGPVTVEDVLKVAKAMEAHDGTAPVVFIDYLQLLAPANERDSDKQTADKNVMALRQMARDLKTPVVVISSLNRSSYSGVISMDSFKESGGIEYGADLLLGLQPEGMADKAAQDKGASTKNADAAIEDCKRASERRCEIVVLKNRNGSLSTDPVPVTMRAASSVFEEGLGCSKAVADASAKRSSKKPL